MDPSPRRNQTCSFVVLTMAVRTIKRLAPRLYSKLVVKHEFLRISKRLRGSRACRG